MFKCQQGPFKWEQARSNCRLFLSPAVNSSQYLNTFACKFLYLWRCCRFNLSSDRSRTCSDTREDSWCRRLINKYMGSFARLAWWFNRRCQPSTSLFVRTLRWKMLHLLGDQRAESIQVVCTYWTRFCSGSDVARSFSELNMGLMCSWGRNGKAIICLMYLCTTSSSLYAEPSPSPCTFRQVVSTVELFHWHHQPNFLVCQSIRYLCDTRKQM